MRLVFAAAAVLAVAASAHADNAFAYHSVADITTWVGTGPNSAGIVFDWHDGKIPATVTVGYHWSGTATGEDMLTAVTAAYPLFHADIRTGAFGDYLFGLGYDSDANGFTYVPGPLETGSAADPADHYAEGFLYNGYWSYYNAGPGQYWDFGDAGMSDRILSNGDWDGWSFAPASSGWDAGPPTFNVPEPATLGVLMCGSLFFRRRRN